MDRFGDHASVCCCGGDRVVRHNAVRDQVYDECRKGSGGVEREKPGLLPGRPQGDGLPAPAQARRPADIWLAAKGANPPLALDFAITSGLRCPTLGAREADLTGVFAEYEELKRNHQDTDTQCRGQGLLFTPFVVEAHAGGLSPLARRTVDGFAKDIATACHLEPSAVSLRIAQRISTSLQRESARAILRRQAGGTRSATTHSGWDAVPPEHREWQ